MLRGGARIVAQASVYFCVRIKEEACISSLGLPEPNAMGWVALTIEL